MSQDIYGITAETESNNKDFNADGSYVTSPKGARGRMQVMPTTQNDPGYGVTPAKDDSPEEIARVGREYLAAMRKKYGRMDHAWAAYNAGPGKLDGVLKQHGDNWLQNMPGETQRYVQKNMAKLEQEPEQPAAEWSWDFDDEPQQAQGQSGSDWSWDFNDEPMGSGGKVVGTEVVKNLFPEARVTSGYRGPDHPLSKKNPKSWHAVSEGAVDMAPIAGMTFEEAVERFEANGYDIIEAKNEVGAGRSAWATGDHWHFVLDRQLDEEQSGRSQPQSSGNFWDF